MKWCVFDKEDNRDEQLMQDVRGDFKPSIGRDFIVHSSSSTAPILDPCWPSECHCAFILGTALLSADLGKVTGQLGKRDCTIHSS